MVKAPELETYYVTAEDGEQVKVTVGSGNVFADLGLPDADELFYKANLVHEIGAIIKARHLSQRTAAAQVGLTQPQLSGLLRGNWGGFSTDRLFDILNRLGYNVEVRITKQPEVSKARTLVVAV